MLLNLPVADSKYTIVQEDNGRSYALRYGEMWIDSLATTPGSNMIMAMVYESEAARKELQDVRDWAEDMQYEMSECNDRD